MAEYETIFQLYTEKREAGQGHEEALSHLAIEHRKSKDNVRIMVKRGIRKHPDSPYANAFEDARQERARLQEERVKSESAQVLRRLNVKGTSTLYKDGEVVMEWVKTDRKAEDVARMLEEIKESLVAELPRVNPTPAPELVYEEMAVVIPFGDPHIGLYAWAEETGDDFDLEIAERDLCAAVDRLLDATPPAAECLIANLGDFFHADNMDGTTWRSGHKLDTDTRWSKVLRIGVKIMRYCIEAAARKHQKVTVINAIGNHDDHSSMFLSVCLAQIYENDPRITINDKPTVTHYWRFGLCFVGVHHGHSIKMDKLPLVMASERAQDWGETKYRYFLTGHIHHDSKKEFNGVTVESFRTLAAKDAYATSHGYSSGRDMKALVLHKQFGEIGRHLVSVAMLRHDNRGTITGDIR